ncbi:MAG: hypothetical protein KDD69_17755, partial [Bdellovibrionales bacterium]|nr:hypothetical protein [Bdellovibrionales bacterium]
MRDKTEPRASNREFRHSPRAFELGMTRREFLERSGTAALLVSLAACRPPTVPQPTAEELPATIDAATERLLRQVQLDLFPDDGDGPSAEDLQAYDYLVWALADHSDDTNDDRRTIISGARRLQAATQASSSTPYESLSANERDSVLRSFVASTDGERWVSLL